MSRLDTEIPSQRPPTSPHTQERWDRLVAAGIRPATESFRVHGLPKLVRPRPRWLAFLLRLFR